MDLEPLAPAVTVALGFQYFWQRRYEETRIYMERALELFPSFPYAIAFLGRTYALLGEHEKALAVLPEVELPSYRDGFLGCALVASGQQEKAEQLLQRLQDGSQPMHIVAYQIALTYCALGNHDKAFEWLDRAYQAQSPQLVWSCLDPELDPLRSDPRWKDLMRRIGLDAWH